ncbi:MAG TPA: hypothetical protein VNT81_16945 [Vicinamibacterales bacterium]|nr:hypothetical protein [Vicinamibacterales bacterium]
MATGIPPSEALLLARLIAPTEGGIASRVLAKTSGGNVVEAAPGTIVRMPAGIPHAVDAKSASRMLLIMLREPAAAA